MVRIVHLLADNDLLLLTSLPAASLAAALWIGDPNVRMSLATAHVADAVGYDVAASWMTLAWALPWLGVLLRRAARPVKLLASIIGMSTWLYYTLFSAILGGPFAVGVGIYLAFFLACWIANRRLTAEGETRRWTSATA